MRHRLLRDMSVILIAKIAALTAIYFLFFGTAHQPPLDSSRVARQMIGGDTPMGP